LNKIDSSRVSKDEEREAVKLVQLFQRRRQSNAGASLDFVKPLFHVKIKK